MKKLLLLIAFLAIALQSTFAQTVDMIKTDTARQLQNSTYLEIAGASLVGATFNYERSFSSKPGGFSIRIGLGGGLLPGIFNDNPQFFGAIPAGLYYDIPLSSNKRNFLELGGTYTVIFGGGGDYSTGVMAANAGWRHMSESGKSEIKITLIPYIYSVELHGGTGLVWFGVSFGHRFQK
jgi:hypothetical protein